MLCLVCAPAAATPLISELFYDAVGSDNGRSFVEIYGQPGSDLTGLTLEGVNGSNGAVGPVIELAGTIPADGIFVVADMDGDGLSLVVEADQLANFDFQNGPDSVVLYDGPEVLDAVGYGDFDPEEVYAGEGMPAPDPPAGSSLARVFADVDSDDNLLDFEVLAIRPRRAARSCNRCPSPARRCWAARGCSVSRSWAAGAGPAWAEHQGGAPRGEPCGASLAIAQAVPEAAGTRSKSPKQSKCIRTRGGCMGRAACHVPPRRHSRG